VNSAIRGPGGSWGEICMYTPTPLGGHALYALDLLSALVSTKPHRDLDVSLVTCSDLIARYRTGQYAIHDFLPPMRPVRDFPFPALWSWYRQRYYFLRDRAFTRWAVTFPSCRAVHFQEYTPWLAPAHFPALKRAGLRLFCTVHGVYPHRYMSGVPKAVFHRWCRDAWKQCDALFVHTEGLAHALRQFLGPKHPPVFVTPHGITDALHALPDAAAATQTGGPGRLLFFGVIRPNKGLHVLLQAMRELPDFRLTIAGEFKEASYRRKIRKHIAQLPEGQIRLIDRFVDDAEIPELFARSGLVVLPYTFFHAQSGVLMLALKYGIPVVASDLGGIGETVRAMRIGECVAPDDPKALAGAIRRMTQPHAYGEAKAALEEARSKLSWKGTAELTWQAYLSILDASDLRKNFLIQLI